MLGVLDVLGELDRDIWPSTATSVVRGSLTQSSARAPNVRPAQGLQRLCRCSSRHLVTAAGSRNSTDVPRHVCPVTSNHSTPSPPPPCPRHVGSGDSPTFDGAGWLPFAAPQ